MRWTDALIVCTCSLLIITGSSFLLSVSQKHASQYSSLVGYSSPWNRTRCRTKDDTSPDDELQHFKDTVKSILNMIQNMTHIDQMENTTLSYNAIDEEKDGYKYILTEDSFDEIRRSSLRINEFRGSFPDMEIRISLDPELMLNVKITRPDDASRLIKEFLFTPQNVIFSITKKLDINSNELFTPPKYANFDYTTTVKNHELVDPEPPTDHLIKKIKDLLQSAVEDKLSNEMTRSKILNHFREIQLKIYCTPFKDYEEPYYMKEFHRITSDSIEWKMENVTINDWPEIQTINISYFEKSIKIQIEMANSSIGIMANATNLATRIGNRYEIDRTWITLDADKSEINQLNVTFVGFKSIPQNLIVSDDLVKKALEKSMQMVMLKPPELPNMAE